MTFLPLILFPSLPDGLPTHLPYNTVRSVTAVELRIGTCLAGFETLRTVPPLMLVAEDLCVCLTMEVAFLVVIHRG